MEAAASSRRRGRSEDHGGQLSEREIKILRLAAEGLSNPQIGERLHLSRHTVKEYLSKAMRKLGVSTRVEAVLAASRRGLLD